MGQYEEEPRQYSFNYRTNTGIHYDPLRSVFTDDYHYVWHYMPYKKHGLRQSFQWAMPAQMAWDSLFHFVGAEPEHQQYYLPKPQEMLFDRKVDPFGINNLAHDPAYAYVVAELRKEASNHIRVTKDLGFFPGDVRQYFVDQGISLFEWVRENPYPFDLLHEAAERASAADLNDLNFFRKLLSHDRPEIRFWGASGLAYLAHKDLLARVPEELYQAASDEFTSVASIAAEAMVYAGETTKGLDVLAKLAKETSSYAISSLEQLGHRVSPVLPQIREIAKTSNNGVTRFNARSILINFGEMPMVELFEPDDVEGFVRGQKHRVENWATTRP